MKIKNNIFALLTLLTLSCFSACEKNSINLLGESATGAKVKFLPSCSNCPSLFMTANGQPINPTATAYGGAFPTGGYALLPTGEVTLNFVRSDSNTVFLSTKANFSEGKWYSIYIGDTIPNPTISVFEDDIQAFQDTFLRVRFVNVLSGRTKDTLELVRKNTNTVVVSGVTYGKASEFKFVPTTTADTFFYRKVGTTVIYPLTTNTIFTVKRNAQTLTFLARGVIGKTGTGPQIPKIDWWANR
jgi:Domain of unknown function (DUF4397)